MKYNGTDSTPDAESNEENEMNDNLIEDIIEHPEDSTTAEGPEGLRIEKAIQIRLNEKGFPVVSHTEDITPAELLGILQLAVENIKYIYVNRTQTKDLLTQFAANV